MIKAASKFGFAMCLFASAFAASAQSAQPSVHLVVPFNPGGGSSVMMAAGQAHPHGKW
jgi:hypothetical protein